MAEMTVLLIMKVTIVAIKLSELRLARDENVVTTMSRIFVEIIRHRTHPAIVSMRSHYEEIVWADLREEKSIGANRSGSVVRIGFGRWNKPDVKYSSDVAF